MDSRTEVGQGLPEDLTNELSEIVTSFADWVKGLGVAVFHGGRFQGLDLFDRHSTLTYFWDSILDSYAMDLLAAPVDPAQPETDEGQMIRTVLDRAIAGTWESFASPGEGIEWRAEQDDLAAASLVWNEDVVLHLQIFPKTATNEAPKPEYRPRIRRRYGN